MAKNFKFSPNSTYTIGRLRENSFPENPEFAKSPKPLSLVGAALKDMGVEYMYDFVSKNPFNISPGMMLSFFEDVGDKEGTMIYLGKHSVMLPKQEQALLADSKNDGKEVADALSQKSNSVNRSEIHHHDETASEQIKEWQIRFDRMEVRNTELEEQIRGLNSEISELKSELAQAEVEAMVNERVEARIADDGLSDGGMLLRIAKDKELLNTVVESAGALLGMAISALKPQPQPVVMPEQVAMTQAQQVPVQQNTMNQTNPMNPIDEDTD